MDSSTFRSWLTFETNWGEVSWLHKTGKEYQDKQSLFAVFKNSYSYIEEKVNSYHSKSGEFPIGELKEMIFEFQKFFPKNDRIQDINYFDDLLNLLIERKKTFEVNGNVINGNEQFENLKKFLNIYEDYIHNVTKLTLDHEDGLIQKNNVTEFLYKSKIDLMFLSLQSKAINEIENFALNKNQEHIERFKNIFWNRIISLNDSSSFLQKKLIENYSKTESNYLYTVYRYAKSLISSTENAFKIKGQTNEHSYEDKSKEIEQNEPIYPETELNVEFNPQIFKDEYSSRLFCYLIDSYHNGKDVELSNIYQWMENKKLIHQNKRQEYRAFVIKLKITEKKYSRVHAASEYKSDNLDPTFNELQKKFDRETK